MSTTLAALSTASHTVGAHMVGWGPGFGWWFLLIPLAMATSLLLAVFGGATLEALEDVLLRQGRCPRCGSAFG